MGFLGLFFSRPPRIYPFPKVDSTESLGNTAMKFTRHFTNHPFSQKYRSTVLKTFSVSAVVNLGHVMNKLAKLVQRDV